MNKDQPNLTKRVPKFTMICNYFRTLPTERILLKSWKWRRSLFNKISLRILSILDCYLQSIRPKTLTSLLPRFRRSINHLRTLMAKATWQEDFLNSKRKQAFIMKSRRSLSLTLTSKTRKSRTAGINRARRRGLIKNRAERLKRSKRKKTSGRCHTYILSRRTRRRENVIWMHTRLNIKGLSRFLRIQKRGSGSYMAIQTLSSCQTNWSLHANESWSKCMNERCLSSRRTRRDCW